jgi:hypothetical protein
VVLLLHTGADSVYLGGGDSVGEDFSLALAPGEDGIGEGFSSSSGSGDGGGS